MIEFFLKGGLLMWPILGCSVVALTLIIVKTLQLRSVLNRLSPSVEILLEKHPPAVSPIIDGIRRGLDEKQLSFLGTRALRGLEKGLGLLSLIAVIAPLLGFTGTVTGMIQGFMVIAAHSGGRVEPSMVAGGIYEALITTAGGLFVAIPSHVALHFLEERVDEIGLRIKEMAMILVEGGGHGV
jgi:biopolymer transport protein ExbB